MILTTNVQVFRIISFIYFSQHAFKVVKGFQTSKNNAFFGQRENNNKIKVNLIPEENQSVDLNRKSVSNVPYGSVLLGLKELYPPLDLSKRNAISRSDGYWSYLKNGEEAPQHLTYGEFDFLFFCELLDRAHHYYFGGENQSKGWEGKVFVDIGSGAGRLVIGAAALHPVLSKCKRF